MKYLYTVAPSRLNLSVDDVRFETPTYRVPHLKNELDKILPNENGSQFLKSSKTDMLSNIAHRINYIEYLNAILSCHYKLQKDYNKSSLCGGIPEMMSMNFCILVYSVFEGLGTYLVRCESMNEVVCKVNHSNWSAKLSEYVAKKDFPSDKKLCRSRRKRYQKIFDKLRDYRDHVHLDKPLEKTNYNEYENRKAYKFSLYCIRSLAKRHIATPNINFISLS